MSEARCDELELLASYRQIHVHDDEADVEFSDVWFDVEVQHLRVAVLPEGFAIETMTDGIVDVSFRVSAQAEPDPDVSAWDHVVVVGLTSTSGVLVVRGPMKQYDEAFRVEVPVGPLTALVMGKGLQAAFDEDEALDRYAVVVWPGAVPVPRLLKQFVAQRAQHDDA